MVKDLRVELSGLKLDNPIIPASGTFGYGREHQKYYDIRILGSIAIKGTTLKPKNGNQQPRIAECTEGMINSIGLENPGMREVIENELGYLREVYKKPVIANICGFSFEEYITLSREISKVNNVGILEINISCPNVDHGGMSFGTDPETVRELTKEIKKVSTKPVYMKLSPNVTDIVAIANAAKVGGADGIVLINTLMGMRVDIKTGKPVMAAKRGGFSGPAIFPVALRMVYEVYAATGLPIIGVGGISTAADVIEMIMAGATAVEVGTANLVNPYVCREIIDDLPALMDDLGISTFDEIRGRAHQY